MRRLWAWLSANSAPLQAVSSVFIIGGLILTYTQLRLVHSQAQAMTMLEINRTEHELFEKIWADPDLRQILEPRAPSADHEKMTGYVTILLDHYETVYRERQLGQIPPAFWREIEITLKQLLSKPVVGTVWNQARCVYPPDFRAYIDALSPLRTQSRC